MRQVDVLALRLDDAEHGAAGNRVLADSGDGIDVPVLHRPSIAAVDGDAPTACADDGPGRDRIDRRAVRRRDVETLMEGERAVPAEDGLLAVSALEDGSRIAEATADRMRSVERRHGPAVRAGATGCG